MIQTLQAFVVPVRLALQTIPLLVSTAKGSQLTYIIVESEYDQSVYNKFFDLQQVHIFTSSMVEKNYQESCTCVEEIVYQITQSIQNVTLLGIRDADYTAFNSTYTLPENIFRTDARDIEMMMFECIEVKRELKKMVEYFDDFYTKSLTIARPIGFFRMVNDKHHLGFSFKKNLKYDQLLDSHTGDLVPGAIESFVNTFFVAVSNYTVYDFETFKIAHQTTNDNAICRGHDVMTLLANYLKNKITKKEIELALAVYYDFTSFQSTTLYADISRWGNGRNKVLFRV